LKLRIWFAAILVGLGALVWASSADKKKDTYLQHAKSDLQDLSAKVDSLQKRSETAGTKTREELDRQMELVREKLELARQKVAALEHPSEGTWKSIRKSAEIALKDVKKAYRKAASFFHSKESPQD
jgi:hypothetical protein